MKVSFYAPLLALCLSGCSVAPAPLEQMKLTERTLQQVAKSEANTAQAEYEMAVQRFERAQKNMQEQDYKRARVLAEQAELDARLAEAKALREESDQALQAVTQDIERLRKNLAGEQ